MPKRGGRGGKRKSGAPRERRPALLGAPRPRPAPRPQPLPPPSEVEEAPAPVKPRKPRAKPTAYDKLLAGLQRSAQPAKRTAERSAEKADERPKKIAATAEEDDQTPQRAEAHSEEALSTAASDAESASGAENEQAADDDADVTEGELVQAVRAPRVRWAAAR